MKTNEKAKIMPLFPKCGIGNVLKRLPAIFCLATAVLLFSGCGKSEKAGRKVNLSLKAEAALNYVNSLPEGQRNVLLHGTGSADDKANALANLSSSGHLEGFEEYLKATENE